MAEQTVMATLGKAGIHVEGAWSAETEYERLALVHSGLKSYVSRKAVPAGTALTDAEHWYEMIDAEAFLQPQFDAKVDVWQEQIDKVVGAYLEYDEELGEYTNLAAYFHARRDGRIWSVKLPKYDFSSTVTGEKLNDNAGMVCVPSTASTAGQDDYRAYNAWTCLNVNGYASDDGEWHVTAIEGDSHGFARDGSNGDVYVINPPRFFSWVETADWLFLSMSDVQHAGYQPMPGLMRLDKTLRGFMLRAKYAGGKLDGKLVSASGVPLWNRTMSHDSVHTHAKARGAAYSGLTTADWFACWLDFSIKYATKSSQTVFAGCTNYYLRYSVAKTESGVNRIVLTDAQAANLLVGSYMMLGTATSSPDLGASNAYDIFDQQRITSKEALSGDDAGYTAVYFAEAAAFDVTAGQYACASPWRPGACDTVLGVDGSPTSCTSGKEPFICQNVEQMVGVYEVCADVIMNATALDDGTLVEQVYVCNDCTKYASSLTAAYLDTGLSLPIAGSDGWSGSKDMALGKYGVLVPQGYGVSNSTGTGDSVFQNVRSYKGLRELLLFGDLDYGSLAGLSCVDGHGGLGSAWWNIGSRLSLFGLRGVSA